MANFLAPEKIAQIKTACEEGLSLRAIEKLVGVSKNTVARYIPKAADRGLCHCGAEMGHKGWCKWRYERSAARQAYHASRYVWRARDQRVERISFSYPYLPRDSGRDDQRLVRIVNAAVSRGFDNDLRADICQELIVGLLSGDLLESDLAASVKKLSRQYATSFSERRDHVPMDWAIPGTGGGLRIEDAISEEDSIWEQI